MDLKGEKTMGEFSMRELIDQVEGLMHQVSNEASQDYAGGGGPSYEDILSEACKKIRKAVRSRKENKFAMDS